MTPAPRTIRRFLWRANALLAAGIVAVAAVALTRPGSPDPLPQLEEIPAPQRAAPLAPEAPGFPLDGFLASIRHVHPGSGTGAAARQAPPPQTEAPDGRLPLTALRVVGFLDDPHGPRGVCLRSKDPAHPEVYRPWEDRPDGGISITGIREEGGRRLVSVSRGQEAFTYVIDSERQSGREVFRAPAAEARRGLAATSASPRDTSVSGRSVGVKVVPFFSPTGSPIGVRVTGVEPGGWFQRAGVRSGDVISSAGDLPVRTAADLQGRVRDGPGPGDLILDREEAGQKVRLILRGS